MPIYYYKCRKCDKKLMYFQPYKDRENTKHCVLCRSKNSLDALMPCPTIHIHLEDGSGEGNKSNIDSEDAILIEEDDLNG